ncbi:DUF3089 domain-containing protein [Stakelama tenebrarum]|uniref:DUF3089 domain-containing protein n=1 Tax=Stakelama tenebrarum TaxID=2711215 RepID=A0A6G6YB85_9SPHN|nr:DUF3089 domain-containing protein [Sphingosinithalassobacter tenebrarum]QIG81968.1 DUF3089 domain-containing protein [Sphingosinithalassobacter tenebrarum]
MVRIFLYGVAALVMLALAAAFTYRFWGMELLRRSMVPSAGFAAQPPVEPEGYARADMWLARPDKPGNPALWTPADMQPASDPTAAVFFVHPTSYMNRNHWNAPLDDVEANSTLEIFLRGQASAFNGSGAIWAPRYRQATFGAFLTSDEAAQQALDLAYGDVLAAFEEFLKQAGDRPIILAGHSQGSLHLTRLLAERIAGTPIAERIVAAYVVGWPVSITADLPALGLPACTDPDQPGCILSWQSFAEPADPSLIFDKFDTTDGYTGAARKDSALLCVNPITGKPDDAAPKQANLGTLLPDMSFSSARMVAGGVPARCEGRGILSIGKTPPNLGQFVLPGNNYHVFDYSLFWANVRADANRRLAAFEAR